MWGNTLKCDGLQFCRHGQVTETSLILLKKIKLAKYLYSVEKGKGKILPPTVQLNKVKFLSRKTVAFNSMP